MGRNLRIGALVNGLLQVFQRCHQVAHAILQPAHAVEDERVVGQQFERLSNEFQGFVVTVGLVGQGVTERVIGVGVVRFKRNQLAHVTLVAINHMQHRSHQPA